MNAVLQALASTGSVLEWLEVVQGGRLTTALEHILQREVFEPTCTVLKLIVGDAAYTQCTCFMKWFSGLREGDRGVASPAPVLKALIWHGWSLDYQQQVCTRVLYTYACIVLWLCIVACTSGCL